MTSTPQRRPATAAEVGGRVVASATCQRSASWWWGQVLPTAGIAGVKVAPEHRGQGLAARLVRTLTDEARGWGAVVSTLKPPPRVPTARWATRW
ncbi:MULTISPECIES: GNAT family N-acetyltransferase [Kytococcus]|uniref:GNAT family N-acetyltransferase n=1 Tax=Kytococcus schroeteri TaxID=138300 RepID=A0A2I1PBA1_9MICO|nr:MULTISPECIES: GNAT family N-acetyltransferase [Kytococcus]OFS16147.1 hypothetical protein HMPREF3099_00135 [Kytococcus sp. HMSC28H12]PKZ41904.1 GNAT family N-acetyltransferase [Kytococcus schroeteri]